MVNTICERLGDAVYGVDVPNLESVVKDELLAHHVCLAVAESCTGGLVSTQLTGVPGISACFYGGVIAYDTCVKTGALGVSEKCIERFGVVSNETALAMAQGVAEVTGVQLGLGITGLAGPDGDGSDVPVGTVCLSLYDKRNEKNHTLKDYFGDERERVRIMAAKTALNMVRRYLQDL